MDQYVIERVVGEGSFGKALLCSRKNDRKRCIIKQIKVSAMSKQEALKTKQEATLLSVLCHPNIVSFWESFYVSNRRVPSMASPEYLCIVMEYADGGDLAQFISNRRGNLLSEKAVVDIFIQICLGLKHIHDRKIIHRDLKAQNIFLTRDQVVKLGDFGVSRVLRNTMELAQTQIGTPLYMSPEIFQNRKYNSKNDIWSLGCVLYELMALRPPFNGGSMQQLRLNIINGTPQPLSRTYSEELRALARETLDKDPNKRPGINTILQRPVMKMRAEQFLDQVKFNQEFAHTILHGHDILARNLPKPPLPTPPTPPPPPPPAAAAAMAAVAAKIAAHSEEEAARALQAKKDRMAKEIKEKELVAARLAADAAEAKRKMLKAKADRQIQEALLLERARALAQIQAAQVLAKQQEAAREKERLLAKAKEIKKKKQEMMLAQHNNQIHRHQEKSPAVIIIPAAANAKPKPKPRPYPNRAGGGGGPIAQGGGVNQMRRAVVKAPTPAAAVAKGTPPSVPKAQVKGKVVPSSSPSPAVPKKIVQQSPQIQAPPPPTPTPTPPPPPYSPSPARPPLPPSASPHVYAGVGNVRAGGAPQTPVAATPKTPVRNPGVDWLSKLELQMGMLQEEVKVMQLRSPSSYTTSSSGSSADGFKSPSAPSVPCASKPPVAVVSPSPLAACKQENNNNIAGSPKPTNNKKIAAATPSPSSAAGAGIPKQRTPISRPAMKSPIIPQSAKKKAPAASPQPSSPRATPVGGGGGGVNSEEKKEMLQKRKQLRDKRREGLQEFLRAQRQKDKGKLPATSNETPPSSPPRAPSSPTGSSSKAGARSSITPPTSSQSSSNKLPAKGEKPSPSPSLNSSTNKAKKSNESPSSPRASGSSSSSAAAAAAAAAAVVSKSPRAQRSSPATQQGHGNKNNNNNTPSTPGGRKVVRSAEEIKAARDLERKALRDLIAAKKNEARQAGAKSPLSLDADANIEIDIYCPPNGMPHRPVVNNQLQEQRLDEMDQTRSTLSPSPPNVEGDIDAVSSECSPASIGRISPAAYKIAEVNAKGGSVFNDINDINRDEQFDNATTITAKFDDTIDLSATLQNEDEDDLVNTLERTDEFADLPPDYDDIDCASTNDGSIFDRPDPLTMSIKAATSSPSAAVLECSILLLQLQEIVTPAIDMDDADDCFEEEEEEEEEEEDNEEGEEDDDEDGEVNGDFDNEGFEGGNNIDDSTLSDDLDFSIDVEEEGEGGEEEEAEYEEGKGASSKHGKGVGMSSEEKPRIQSPQGEVPLKEEEEEEEEEGGDKSCNVHASTSSSNIENEIALQMSLAPKRDPLSLTRTLISEELRASERNLDTSDDARVTSNYSPTGQNLKNDLNGIIPEQNGGALYSRLHSFLKEKFGSEEILLEAINYLRSTASDEKMAQVDMERNCDSSESFSDDDDHIEQLEKIIGADNTEYLDELFQLVTLLSSHE